MRVAAMLLILATAALPATARADGVRLVVDRGPGAASCPDQAGVRAQVIARLGYDPFDDASRVVVSCAIGGEAQELVARLSVDPGDGGPPGERVLRAPAAHGCDQLMASVVLAISIAVDPLVPAPPAPAPATPPPVARAARPRLEGRIDQARGRASERGGGRDTTIDDEDPLELLAHAPHPLREPAGVAWHWSLGVVGNFGDSLSPNLGFLMGAGMRHRWWSIAGEVRGDTDGSRNELGGSVSAGLRIVSAMACGHADAFALCFGGRAGYLASEGHGLEMAHGVSTPYLGGLARLRYDYPLSAHLALRAQADMTLAFDKTTLLVAGFAVWRTPALSASVGTALVVLFP